MELNSALASILLSQLHPKTCPRPATRTNFRSGIHKLIASAERMGKISNRSKKIRSGQKRTGHCLIEQKPATPLSSDPIAQTIEHTLPAASIDRDLALEMDSAPSSLICDTPNQSLHCLSLMETQSESAQAPAPRMWPALLRVYEDRVVRVTLLNRKDGGAANLFPSRSSISAARVLLFSAVLASGSALCTKTMVSSLLPSVLVSTTLSSSALRNHWLP